MRVQLIYLYYPMNNYKKSIPKDLFLYLLLNSLIQLLQKSKITIHTNKFRYPSFLSKKYSKNTDLSIKKCKIMNESIDLSYQPHQISSKAHLSPIQYKFLTNINKSFPSQIRRKYHSSLRFIAFSGRKKYNCSDVLNEIVQQVLDNQIKHMISIKQNLLSIEYDNRKGLVLSWSLGALLGKTSFIRHLFILSSQEVELAEKVSMQICSKVKNGDFLAFIYSKNNAISKVKWSQKTALSQEPPKLSTKLPLRTDQVLSILPQLGKECSDYSTPIILNIFTDDTKSITLYKQCISNLRTQGHFSYHVNFFTSSQQNDVSPSQGFNTLLTRLNTLDEVSQIYRSLSSESAAAHIRLELFCQGMQIKTKKSSHWHRTDFSRISRDYYGPSVYYDKDYLDFVDDSSNKEPVDITISIHLQAVLLNGALLQAKKSFILTADQIRFYALTRNEIYEKPLFQFKKSVWSKSSPYGSQTTVYFKKIAVKS